MTRKQEGQSNSALNVVIYACMNETIHCQIHAYVDISYLFHGIKLASYYSN